MDIYARRYNITETDSILVKVKRNGVVKWSGIIGYSGNIKNFGADIFANTYKYGNFGFAFKLKFEYIDYIVYVDENLEPRFYYYYLTN